MIGQRDAAHVHAQKAGNDVDGQGHDGNHGQHKQAAVVGLGHAPGYFFLQQLDALLQGGHVAERHVELFGRLMEVFNVCLADPSRGFFEQAKQGGRLGREQALQPHQQAA